MAAITYSYSFRNAKVRQRESLGGTLMVENLTAIATVMFTVGERERSPAAETDFRIYPLWSCLCVDHG
jgi:hypothetical protein